MNAGEIRRPVIGPISESANHSIHRAWVALGDATGQETPRQGHEQFRTAAFDALLAEPGFSAEARRTVEQLIQRNRSLESEVGKLRSLLQEWIVSQQTYQALYYRYSGQSADAPREDLMREKEQMRRSIRGQLNPGENASSLLAEQTRSLSES